jgi:hypothetical protein
LGHCLLSQMYRALVAEPEISAALQMILNGRVLRSLRRLGQPLADTINEGCRCALDHCGYQQMPAKFRYSFPLKAPFDLG